MTIKTPDWVKNAVFYQIFPDRFAIGSQTPKGHWQASSLEGWDATPTLQGYKGGNLWGVIEKLDYLKDLGITAIYFTPIFQSASNHRYHTHDYYQIDPMLGGNVAFQALIEAAHQKDIKVILDGVFNHASRGFFFFNDILENGPYSPWLDWFKIHGWPLSAYDGSKPANYEGWLDNRALPVFNHDNEQAREYIMQVGEYWIHQGIDGWRLDVPEEIKTPGFWQEFRTRIKAINPEAYIVGEIWFDASEWLDGTQFDGVMNYMFAVPTIAFVAGDRFRRECSQFHYHPYPGISAEEYASKIKNLLHLYPWEIQLTQLNLLDSHDTARLITSLGGDQKSVELATILLFTFPGAPSIFYGDEVGLIGAKDPDSRRGFPRQEKWDLEVLNYHRKLISLRNQYPALRTGNYQILSAEDSVYVFARSLEQETIIVAINTDSDAQRVNFSTSGLQSTPSHLLYGDAQISWQSVEEQNYLELTIPPQSGLIIG
ncbi:pullulanase [Stanieria cyanosphaera PCC 7437]|uniref:Pullulanase n=1 Tax=Stanieria cyanosphaera (strain ATCC 29371 / PCC 7437) TaxID=111780 RepID=K9XRY5_STAC7|nr:glycoside hydrolase family 13 protein [Stanieria cyanosphaera]AFZ35288.1 pullulanase [Stanieria cyanosphaera PCC 7437]